MTQAQELEEAILARAKRLANEYIERAHRSRDAILREAAEKLRLREQREEAIAKSLGERDYRRQVQAEELRLQSHLDRVRWNLVCDVEHRLAKRMREFATDEQAYLQTLIGFIATAAAEIERDSLTLAANTRDRRLLEANWDAVLQALPADKRLHLADEPIDTVGGVLLTDEDARIRVDNCFEGRLARLRTRIQQSIQEHLLPSGFDTSSMFGG